MTLTELQALFAGIGLIPSRKLGQNFLIDQNICRWIVQQLVIEEGDHIVEVGPGAGGLTREILQRSENLTLIEKDGRLAAFLAQEIGDRPSVEIHNMDACQFDARSLFPRQPVKLIGNLPYSAGGEIIRNFLGPHSPVCEAVLMLQREVAKRICAKPGGKDFGILTLRVQARWEVSMLKNIVPECFFPRPKIESTVIRLTPRPAGSLPVYDHRLFDATVRRGFSQRRKQLRKCLDIDRERWESITNELGLSESVRAEQVDLQQWVRLTNLLDDNELKDNPQRGDELFDVVDSENQVIGQKTRAEVHREGLLHRAAHIFAFNKSGELFLQKRSRLKDVDPGLWGSSASGHLDAGEDFASAAAREVREELGLELAVEKVADLPPSESNGNEFLQLFRAEVSGKPRWPASEVEFGQYFPIAVIESWLEARPNDFAGGFKECFAAIQA
ncbi:MAG: 16S rRNA (adenine1518-N6/adenine1519-N6)-dimethyltransferase [Verrucomicrobiales bacterium]|jgi:16S rRNA (adenine1518-N6/adenine1519-N6)-dimethyltransferase